MSRGWLWMMPRGSSSSTDRLIPCTWYVGFDGTAEAVLRGVLAEAVKAWQGGQ